MTLIGVLGLALVLRIININQSLWLDEAAQTLMSSLSLKEIFFGRLGDFHPPLSYALFHFWMQMGRSEIWLRMLPVLFGVGTVFGVYLLGRQFLSKNYALLAALFLAVSAFHIYYSQEIRMYSMAAFFTVFSFYFFWQTPIQSGQICQWKNWRWSVAGYILATALLLYTHYLGIFIIVSQFFFLILNNRIALRKFVLFWFVIGLSILPAAQVFYKQLTFGVNIDEFLPGWRSVLTLSPLKSIPLIFFKFMMGRVSLQPQYFYALVMLLVLSVVVWFLWQAWLRRETSEVQMLLVWLIVPIVLSLAISFRVPLMQPFRLIICLPALTLIFAYILQKTRKFKLVQASAVVLIFLAGDVLYFLDTNYWREDWRSATIFVHSNTKDSGRAVFAWPEPFPPYRWYAGEARVASVVSRFPATPEEVEMQMQVKVAKEKRVYLFEYLQKLSDPKQEVQKWLESHDFRLEKKYDFPGVGFVDEYVRKTD